MRGRFGLLMLALLALVISLTGGVLVSAQSVAIAPGDSVEGALDVTNPFLRYDLSLDAAAEVTITLESSDFDAYMLLEDAAGDVVADDDDSAGRLNAQIVTTLDAGDYVIVATSLRAFQSDYSLFASGDFMLSLTAAASDAPADAPDSDSDPAQGGDVLTIAPDDVLEGELTADAPEARYALAVDAPIEATITLESEEFDAYLLVVVDATGTIVAEDDDSGGLLNAQIVTVLEPGDYKVVVTSLRALATDGDEAGTGAYTLALTAVDVAGDAGDGAMTDSGIAGTPVGAIGLDEAIDGELNESTTIALYDFTLDGPLGVRFTLESSQFDAYLVVYDAGGVVLAEDDDSAGLLNSQVEVDLEAGSYVIAATSLRAYRSEGDLFEAGDYTLTASVLGTGAEADAGSGDEEADADDNEDNEDIEGANDNADEDIADGGGEDVDVPEGTLTVGSTVEGVLTEDAYSIGYPLMLDSTQTLTITLISELFDPYLVLLLDGEIIAEDDDSAGLLDSQIEITLDAGNYVVIATSFTAFFTNGDEGQTGDFTLSVEGTAVDGPAGGSDDPSSVAIGDTVEGRVGPERPSVRYALDAEAGTVVTITLTSEDFDTYLEILDANGSSIITDDDSAGSLDSRITAFIVPQDGPVTIVATSYGATFRDEPESGDFVLRVDEPIVQEIVYAETVDSLLDETNNVQVFTFTGQAGEIVSVTLETSSPSLYMEMTGNGVNAFSSGGAIGPVILPEDGEYAITVASFDITVFEPFTINLSTVEPISIAYDEPVIEDFTDDFADYYTFEASEGDIVNIVVESGQAVDTVIRIIAPNGSEITFDDDSGAGFDPEIRGFELFESGTYSVVVQPYIRGDNGEYTLTVENEAGRSLDVQSYVIRISDKQFVATMSFEGVAGETVTLVARPLAETRAEPRVTVEQDGVLLANNPVGQVGSLGMTFSVPEDGIVTVKVEDFNGNASVIEFTLVRVETP